MSSIPFPVICNNGHVWFAPWLVSAGPGTTVNIQNTTVSPCPNCGGIGRIPDGEYSVTGGQLFSQADLATIANALTALKEKANAGASAEEIKDEISNKYPFLEYLKPLIPKTPADVVAYLFALSVLLNHCAKQPDVSQLPQVHVQVEVQQILEQVSPNQKTSQPNSQQQQSKPKVP